MTVVTLDLFTDEWNSGLTGFAHQGTHDLEEGAFDPFYDAYGLFHDVFEHEFEGKHPLFTGQDRFCTVGGETAAMGAMCYIVEEIGRHERNPDKRFRSHFDPLTNGVGEIWDHIEETFSYGYTRAGERYHADMPPQPEGSYNLENMISELQYRVEEFDWTNVSYEDKAHERRARVFRDSVTADKIASLYRWGYHKAARRIQGNSIMLLEFLHFFTEFCGVVPAEELKDAGVRQLKVSWNGRGWRGRFVMGYPMSDVIFNQQSYPAEVIERVLRKQHAL